MRRCTRIKETTRLTHRNVQAFLRRFAKQIDIDDLEFVPSGPYSASFTFYYQRDKVLKVNKVGSRPSLLKETILADYLSKQDLRVSVPRPLYVHPKGFYAVFSRIDAAELAPQVVMAMSESQRESLVRSLGEFLTFLHSEDMPHEVKRHVPQPKADLKLELKQARRGLECLREHEPGFEVTSFEERLQELEECTDQVWAITHSDFSLGNILVDALDVERLSIIDFTDAEMADPSVDFACLQGDLEDEELEPAPIIEGVLKHYETEDPALRAKIEFRRLVGEIMDQFRSVRLALRRAGKDE